MNFTRIGQYLFMIFFPIDMEIKINYFFDCFLLEHVGERTSSSLNHSVNPRPVRAFLITRTVRGDWYDPPPPPLAIGP